MPLNPSIQTVHAIIPSMCVHQAAMFPSNQPPVLTHSRALPQNEPFPTGTVVRQLLRHFSDDHRVCYRKLESSNRMSFVLCCLTMLINPGYAGRSDVFLQAPVSWWEGFESRYATGDVQISPSMHHTQRAQVYIIMIGAKISTAGYEYAVCVCVCV